jgi:hypothetical protein
MSPAARIAVVAVALALLGGCSSAKKLISKNDDTVLPGKREDALPPSAQQPPLGSGQPSQTAGQTGDGMTGGACPPDDAECIARETAETSSGQ